MNSTHIDRSSLPLHDETKTEAAFLKMRPRYLALSGVELVYLNVDLATTISTAGAAAQRMLELRPQMARLPDFDPIAVDDLPDAVLGLEHTHAEVLVRSRPADDLEDLGREAMQTRERFVHDLANLGKNGVIDPRELGRLTGLTGYKALVTDIRLCLATYRAIGSRAEGKSCCGASDLDRAEAVIHRMGRLIGHRALGRTTVHEWVDLRARAFTVLYNYYGQARRAVTYLRWNHNDIDAFAPSLYKGRIKKRRSAASANPSPPEATKQAEAPPIIGPHGPFVAAPADDAAHASPRIPGMPGGSPFML